MGKVLAITKNIFKDSSLFRYYFRSCLNIISYYLNPEAGISPNTVFIAVNSICNLRCKMCDVGQKNINSQFYKNMSSSGKELSIERLKLLIDEIKSFRPIIAVTSTEPLLYKDIMNFAQYSKSKGLEFHLTTNGYLLSKFAQEIVDSEIDVLSISLDGPQEIHNEIRGKNDSFQRAYEGIKLIEKIKKENKRFKPKINLNCCISDYNHGSLVYFMESVKDLEIDSVLLSHLNFVTKEMAKAHNKRFNKICPATPSSISALDLSRIDIDVLWEQISLIKSRYNNVIFIPELNKTELDVFYNHPEQFLKGHDKCLVPWKSAQILANGDLTISTRCFNLKLGNINETSFQEAWNGREMKKFRKELRKMGAFPACTRCCGLL